MPEPRKLGVFLCHASQDKPAVRELYKRLKSEGWIDPWLDEENLYPGQDWDLEIEKAVEDADAVIVFLSSNSVTKEGYVQRELRFVLRIADFKPEGAVFVIPVCLNDCPMPRRLSMWQYVDYFPEDHKEWAYQRLLGSLKARAEKLGVPTVNLAEERAKIEKEAREKAATEERARSIAEEHARNEREKPELGEVEVTSIKDGEGHEEKVKGIGSNASLVQKVETGSGISRLSKDKRRGQKWPFNLGFLAIIILICVIGGGIYLITVFPIAPTAKPQAAGDIMVSPYEGMKMLYVPSGNFEMGRWGLLIPKDEMPGIHIVYLDAFWIDQTEVTNTMFIKFTDETGYETDAQKGGSSDVYYQGDWQQVSRADWRHPSGSDSDISNTMDYPVVHVSWNDADAYCSWADRRLPTEAEWEKAASWDEGKNKKYVYPWGNSIDCSLANYMEKLDYCVGDLTAVGSYKDGKSPYGAYDMAGNVWEWVADWYDEAYYQDSPSSNPLGPDSGQDRVLRGGGWLDIDDGVRSDTRYHKVPLSSSNTIGFRCARDASP